MVSLESKFLALPGHTFFLKEDIPFLEAYLTGQGWLSDHNAIDTIEKPGAGNMNIVLRVVLKQGDSFIIKQARPWVEKYPQLEAPADRIEVEHQYYLQVTSNAELATYSPYISGFDQKNHLLKMQDLGKSSDFSFIYGPNQSFEQYQLQEAIIYLNNLKSIEVPPDYPDNEVLRALNHQHIFVLPFDKDNDFDLDAIQMGLQALANPCTENELLKLKALQLGAVYLQKGSVLVHGDFYPGSLLKVGGGLKVIDPEFSFKGPEEWDLAIFTAHLFLAGTSPERIQFTFNLYQRNRSFDSQQFAGFVGVEILRRLIGLAQLPLELNLTEKSQLIQRATAWIIAGKIDLLE